MIFGVITVVLLSLATAIPAFAKCDGSDPRLSEQIKTINKKWEILHKAMAAAKFTGKEVKRGKCAVTLLRIGAPAPFALAPDESTKDAHEAISCLALEKWQIVQECKCQDRGLKFSRNDENAETTTLQAYKDIQVLKSKALKLGVQEKAIRSYVERADEIKSCFDANTVATLRKIESDISSVAKSVSGTQ